MLLLLGPMLSATAAAHHPAAHHPVPAARPLLDSLGSLSFQSTESVPTSHACAPDRSAPLQLCTTFALLKTSKGFWLGTQDKSQHQVSSCISALPQAPSPSSHCPVSSTPKTMPCLCSFSPFTSRQNRQYMKSSPCNVRLCLVVSLAHLHASDLHPGRLVLFKPPAQSLRSSLPSLWGQAAGRDQAATPCPAACLPPCMARQMQTMCVLYLRTLPASSRTEGGKKTAAESSRGVPGGLQPPPKLWLNSIHWGKTQFRGGLAF